MYKRQVFIPPRNNEIRIQGPVKRPAIYELKDGEDFQDLLRFTAGLQPEIYTDRFQINRIIPIEERSDASRAREILDFNLNDVLTGNIPITLVDGDRIQLFSITDINDQVVEINGAVDQPGTFELNQELQTIRDLILAADGLSENAYLGQAELIRTNDDLTQSYFTVNLAEAISGNEAELSLIHI